MTVSLADGCSGLWPARTACSPVNRRPGDTWEQQGQQGPEAVGGGRAAAAAYSTDNVCWNIMFGYIQT